MFQGAPLLWILYAGESCWCASGDALQLKGSYLRVRGSLMKPAACASVARLKKISEILLVFVFAIEPMCAHAQRGGAGAHAAGGARAGGVAVPRVPAVRVPPAASRPTTPSPFITHPAASPFITHPIIGRPVGGVPITGLRTPVSPFRTPLTGSGILFSSRPPRRPLIGPVGPFLGTASLFGLAYNPFLFAGCNPFWGLANGCGPLAPYYGYGVGYFPPAYPSAPGYPSAAPDYPSGPVYTPPDNSATLQYTPPIGQYPSLPSLPTEDLSASTGLSTRLLNEVLLYFKDGSVFSVASYTVSDGRLHYVTGYGDKNDVSVDQLDLQKTIEANAARGVAFTLTPASPGAASSPSPLGPAPAPPGPIIPPKQ